MTQQQLAARQERAGNEAFVASKTEEGFRVYSIHSPSRIYIVKPDGDRWTCTCRDFELHKTDTIWRCKHILAVAPWPEKERAAVPEPANGEPPEAAAPPVVSEEAKPSKPRARKGNNGAAQMVIKRSVSPDGRIDSVSVEFALPIAQATGDEIKDKALTTLHLQKEIVGAFLKLNGAKAPITAPVKAPQPQPTNTDGKPIPAEMIDIGKVNGKWGERYCINLAVNGRRSRLFGSAEQLAQHLVAAGCEVDPESIQEGVKLDLACRVTVKPSADGKYLNVEQVFPPAVRLAKGGGHGRTLG